MKREALEALDKETPIRLVLGQARTISAEPRDALPRQTGFLTARGREREARPAAQDAGFKPAALAGAKGLGPGGENARAQAAPGAHRPLHPSPAHQREMIAAACRLAARTFPAWRGSPARPATQSRSPASNPISRA